MKITLDPALLQARLEVLETNLRRDPDNDVAWRDFVSLLDVILQLGATLDNGSQKPLVLG